jgi:sortase A
VISRVGATDDAPASVDDARRSAEALLGRARQGIDVMRARLDRLPEGEVEPQERVLLMSLGFSVEELVARLEGDLGSGAEGEPGLVAPDLAARIRGTRHALDETMTELAARSSDAPSGDGRSAAVQRSPTRPAPLPGPEATGTGGDPHASAAAALGASESADAASETPARRGLARLGRVLTALGIVLVLFLLFEFWASDVSEIRSQRDLLAAFSHALTTGTALQPDALPVAGQPVALLRIPAIGLEQVVVEGTTPELLKQGPGHFRNTPLPGQAGNSVIAGRRTTYGAPFQDLSRLVIGDEIDVTTAEGTFHYTVAATGTVQPGQLDVLSSSSDNRLTLLTSDPAFLANGRLGVIASLEGDAMAAPVLVHPVSLTGNETGLAGDVGGMPAVIVCGEILAVALGLAWFLYRRWNRRVTYLLTTPVILVLLFVLFENLDRLLPGTL